VPARRDRDLHDLLHAQGCEVENCWTMPLPAGTVPRALGWSVAAAAQPGPTDGASLSADQGRIIPEAQS
jgi:hypothetical protein